MHNSKLIQWIIWLVPSLTVGSPLFQQAYLQFTDIVCDNDRVGYFCDKAACYADSDCFHNNCNMYARCESLVKFDMNNHMNEIERDKSDFIANKLAKENSTQSKNQTASSKPFDLPKNVTNRNFQKSPFAN